VARNGKASGAAVGIEVRDVGAGLVGWTWGHGVLNYKGKSHPFEGVKITLEH